MAGIDIGNSSTEVAVARVNARGGKEFIVSGMVETTGVKGTAANVRGALMALEDALGKVRLKVQDLGCIYLNEAAPVITDVAMETITETIITGSSMIGHDPSTPGGSGLGTGETVSLDQLERAAAGQKAVVVVPAGYDFEMAARMINRAAGRGVLVAGAVLQKDDGVLLVNRLDRKIPVVDEVSLIDQVPLGVPAAVEVADPGHSVQTLNNPYGIATVFSLTPEETRAVVPIARSLTGSRSGVVIRTPRGDVRERRIPAGRISIDGRLGRFEVNVGDGAPEIMAAVEKAHPVIDIQGEPGTNIGGMISRIRQTMGELTSQPAAAIRIQDILAVDTLVQQAVSGGLAGELSSESAVALGAMVKTTRLPMEQVAGGLSLDTGVEVRIAGVEAEMAILGALTTPGIDRPLAILDIGGGSTDAALISREGAIDSVHLAGAGDMVTMLIDSELALNNRDLAEDIKRWPLGKLESLFQIRLEDGGVRFFERALDPRYFARVVILKERAMIPLPTRHTIERISLVRRQSKERVFITNCLRALKRIAPAGNIRRLGFVALVGGSALDFEIPGMIAGELAGYGVVAGRANVRGSEGPRNAVATGLILSCNP